MGCGLIGTWHFGMYDFHSCKLEPSSFELCSLRLKLEQTKLIRLKYGMLNQHAFILVPHEAFRCANPHCTRESSNVNSVVYVSCGMTMAIGVHHNKPCVVRCFATRNKV